MAKTRNSFHPVSKYLLGLLTFAVASFAVAIYIQNTVKAEAEPDLSPSTNNASPSDVMWGEQISYTYTLINSGNADGTGMDVYSTLAAGTSNPANFTFTNCGGSVQNTSASSYVELANVTTTMAQNCIVTFEVTVDNPYSGDGTIVNDYRISPAAEGGAEVGPLTANVTTVLSVCGNTILEAEEECDDGNTTDGDGCSSQCTVEAACGDGNVDSGEACDDGNTSNGDGCSSQCEIEPMCGDGNVDNGEECDDDNRTNGDGCSSQCEIEPMCGDGNIDAGEACDDGNTTDGDGCSSQCSDEAFCGDGTVDTGEACDDGNTLNGDGCSSQCTVEAACGDGKVDIGEECDDGNTTNGDGCSSACTIEQGECGECDGKITTLTLRYDGTETTNIEVEQDKGGIIFEDEISPGEVFTLNGVGKNGTLGTKIFIRESGDGNSCDDGGSKDGGSKDNDSSCSETEIHTSCSKEILVGMSFGNFVVVDGASLNGGPICLEEPDLFCPDEPVLIETEEIACWANEAVDWVIENELFSILDEEDVRDAVKFYRFYQFLQEQ